MKHLLEHPVTRYQREVKTGYSFTALIFGFCCDVLRGNFKGVGIRLGLTFLCIAFIWLTGHAISGFLGALLIDVVIWPNLRNKILITHYVDRGWQLREGDPNEICRYTNRKVILHQHVNGSY